MLCARRGRQSGARCELSLSIYLSIYAYMRVNGVNPIYIYILTYAIDRVRVNPIYVYIDLRN